MWQAGPRLPPAIPASTQACASESSADARQGGLGVAHGRRAGSRHVDSIQGIASSARGADQAVSAKRCPRLSPEPGAHGLLGRRAVRRLESHTASRPTWLLASALSDKRIPQRPGSLIKGLNTHSRPRSQKREAAPGSRESSRGRAEPTGQKQRACAAEGRPPPSLPVPRLREGPGSCRPARLGARPSRGTARHQRGRRRRHRAVCSAEGRAAQPQRTSRPVPARAQAELESFGFKGDEGMRPLC